MSHNLRIPIGAMLERSRAALGRRVAAVLLALGLEALLVVLVLTLGMADKREEKAEVPLVSFQTQPDAQKPDPQPESKPDAALQVERPVVQSPQPEPSPAPTLAAPAPIISLSTSQMASADIAAKPARKSQMGPPDTGTPGDTPRVGGSGPNGEPLYAASWYREPYDDELRGYLSTATGPGWGLIACRTVPDFRVEECVGLDEYPRGSNITRSVLAAAWQFRVRPPRIGGVSMVGEWVRIRIDYDVKR